MKQKLLLFTFLLFLSDFVIGQVNTTYSFTSSSSTFDAPTSGLIGSTGAASTTPASIFGTSWDDNISTMTLPFTFLYNGAPYTQITMSSNGFFVFGSSLVGNSTGSAYVSFSDPTGVYLNGTSTNNGVSGFNLDQNEKTFSTFTGTRSTGSNIITAVSSVAGLKLGMRLSGTGISSGAIITAIGTNTVTMSANATSNSSTAVTPRSSIYAAVSGTSPNRTYTITVIASRRFGNAIDNFDYQYKLSESDNSISVIYGPISGDVLASGVPVGIRSTTSDFNNRTTSTNWSSTTAGAANTDKCTFSSTIFPASGLTFKWTYIPPSCPAPNSILVNAISPTSATVSWSGASNAIVEWGPSGCTAGTGATAGACGNVVSGSSPLTITGLAFGSSYSVYVRQDCSGSNNGYSSNVNTPYTHTAGESCVLSDFVTVYPNLASSVNTLLSTGLTADGPAGTCSDGTGNPNKKDRWVKFIAPSNGNKVIITTSSGTITDAVMQVWSSCPASGLALGCSDDVNGLMPQLEFCTLIPGNTYYVQIWPYSSSATGTFNVKIYEEAPCPIPPVNDDCNGIITLNIHPTSSCPDSAKLGSTVNATASPGVVKTTCDAFGTYNDVFYKFNSGSYTQVKLEFTNITGTNEFGIYSGCGIAYLGVCSSSSYSNIISGLTPNTDYTIVVWTNSAATAGNFSLCLSCVEKTWYADADNDGFGDPNTSQVSCNQPDGYILNNLDCNDQNENINPNSEWYVDLDTDGFGAGEATIQCEQPEGSVLNNTDCDDNNQSVYPGNQEICNYYDDDCDAAIDEGVQFTFYADADNDQFGNPNVDTLDCTAPLGYVSNDQDCNDEVMTINPYAAEACDEVDNDCDELTDEGCGCTDPTAHNYDSEATLDDGSCETCSDGIKNGSEVNIDCGGSNPNCPTCPPPTAVCGNIVTVYTGGGAPVYNGPGASDVWNIPAAAFDAGSVVYGTLSNRQVKRKYTNIAFNWTTDGSCIDATPNGVYNNNDKGLVYRNCIPVAPADFGKIRNFDMTISDQFGTSTCEGRYIVINSAPPGGSAPVYTIEQEAALLQALDEESEFSVFPNPGIDQIFIKTNYEEGVDKSVIITDITGRQVLKIKKLTSSLINVDTQTLGLGMYTITLNSANGSQAIKWLKVE